MPRQLMCAASHVRSICYHSAQWTHLSGAREGQQLTIDQVAVFTEDTRCLSVRAKVQNRRPILLSITQ